MNTLRRLTTGLISNRTWGVFLDTGKVVPQAQTNDDFCTFYVDNT